MDRQEVYEICLTVDEIIADELTEAIVIGTSYEMLEAHYGILPISKNCFYIRKRKAEKLIENRSAKIEEEKDGQLAMIFP